MNNKNKNKHLAVCGKTNILWCRLFILIMIWFFCHIVHPYSKAVFYNRKASVFICLAAVSHFTFLSTTNPSWDITTCTTLFFPPLSPWQQNFVAMPQVVHFSTAALSRQLVPRLPGVGVSRGEKWVAVPSDPCQHMPSWPSFQNRSAALSSND